MRFLLAVTCCDRGETKSIPCPTDLDLTVGVVVDFDNILAKFKRVPVAQWKNDKMIKWPIGYQEHRYKLYLMSQAYFRPNNYC